MHDVFEALTKFGLNTVSDFPKCTEWDEATVRRVDEALYAALSPTKIAPRSSDGLLDPFNFVASASLRAESGCVEIPCRFRKLDFLSRYAALYATSVVLPISLPDPGANYSLSYLKPRLDQALFSLLTSRLLINSGRFIPIRMSTAHCCQHELERVAEMKEILGKFMDGASEYFAPEFKVRYQLPAKSPSGLPSIYIEGPEEFLEHGEIVYRNLDGIEPRLSKRRKFDEGGYTQIRGKQKVPFLWPIFEQIANNTSFYLAFRMHYDVRLLTDLEGEALFLRELTDDENFIESTSGLQSLTHALPLLGDMSVETLLRMRSEERDSFEAYRLKIAELTRAALTDGLSDLEAKEMFSTELAPSLEKLSREIKLERKRQKTRIAAGIGALAAGIGIGAFAGLPLAASVPIAAVGTGVGGRMITKAVESICEHGADLRQKNDLYFLLKVIEADEFRITD